MHLTIRFGHWPWHELDHRARGEKLVRKDFLQVSEDVLFSDVMARCWHGEYATFGSIEQDAPPPRLGRSVPKHEMLSKVAIEQAYVQYPLFRAECEEFVGKHQRREKLLERASSSVPNAISEAGRASLSSVTTCSKLQETFMFSPSESFVSVPHTWHVSVPIRLPVSKLRPACTLYLLGYC